MARFISVAAVLIATTVVNAQQAEWAQCGGIGFSGSTQCVPGTTCMVQNPYYSQCLPGANPPPSSTSAPPTSTSTGPQPTNPSSSLPFLGGVNTAGYDFGVATDGSFKGTGVTPPPDQYAHFASEGVNLFRIPFAWQLMTPQLGGSIDGNFWSMYDGTVQAALSAPGSPYVIVDLHNYARWNGGIIGQGGPSNQQYASIWTQIAQKYGSNPKIIFGIMNEPHDLDVPTWVSTVQFVVNAIRSAGSTNYLLLPGSTYSSAGTFSTEAGPALVQVTDPLGGTSKLLFDVHQYLDSDYSGTHPECVRDNVDTLTALVNFLKANGNRQAILSETGGGNTASCETYLKSELAYVKSSGNLIGFAAWSAGAFDQTYTLTLTPNNGQDQPLWTAAIQPNL